MNESGTQAGPSEITWHFQRMGGMDQVTLKTMGELRHLRDLDPKLWGALSCPAAGLEYDERTLALLDEDHDGRIRMPEVLDAVDWVCARLNDRADLTGSPAGLPLEAIDDTNEAGSRLAATARAVLEALGRTDGVITEENVAAAMEGAGEKLLNGDGAFPPHPELDARLGAFVAAGLAIVGGARDSSGKAGLNRALAAGLVRELEIWRDWRRSVREAPHPLGEDTAAAWALLEELRAKVDDFFLRCSLASFAPQAGPSLNAEEKLAEVLNSDTLNAEALAALPVSRVVPEAALSFSKGLNPLWAGRLSRFGKLVRPLLADGETLTLQDWQSVQSSLAPYGAAIAARPAVNVYEEGAFAPAAAPADAIDGLGDDGVARLLDSDAAARFNDLVDRDLSIPAATGDLAELGHLVLCYRHLHRLLMNFVSFYDFYALRRDVTFQAGTLYMDGRSCRLCVPVDDVKAHSGLAGMSQLCLLYCECVRHADSGEISGKRTIMAALTAGSDDFLVVGRNGVFVDNTGLDWDATLVKIIHNPISIRQAVWAPYKRISQMIGEQLARFASSKNLEIMKSVPAKASDTAASAAAGKQPGMPFDIGKSVGIFAAVGIALGALGTAIGSIANALFSLEWWQFPLLIAGTFAVISGPSAFLAWLKLRKRTLGPVLEASGWAVNTQIPINLKLGSALTSLAALPPNIERHFQDPFHDEEGHGCRNLLIVVLLAAIVSGGWLWGTGRLSGLAARFMPRQKQEQAVVPQKHEKPGAAAPQAAGQKKADAPDFGAKPQAEPGK